MDIIEGNTVGNSSVITHSKSHNQGTDGRSSKSPISDNLSTADNSPKPKACSSPPDIPAAAPSPDRIPAPQISSHEISAGKSDCYHDFAFEFDPTKITTETLISKENRGDTGALSDAFNKIHVLLKTNQCHFNAYMSFNDRRFSFLTERLATVNAKINEIDSYVTGHNRALSELNTNKVSLTDFTNLKSDFENLKKSCDSALEQARSLYAEQQLTLDAHNKRLVNMSLDLKRSEKSYSDLVERVNVNDIRAKYLHLSIDGFPESEETSTKRSVIDADASAGLVDSDFALIYRVGQPKPGLKNPRQIRIKLQNEAARDKFLSARSKLKPNPDKTRIWVNEDHPDAYRRRKVMLRELSKYINRLKGHSASLESGGIRVDDHLYTYDQLNDMPDEFHPRNVQVITNKHNCTLFAGEWAFLSNMFPTTIFFEDTKFTSSEQCFQFRKARAHNALDKARKIIMSNDPFVCKKVGDQIRESEDWSNRKFDIMTEINRLKFEQNDNLLIQLLATGDSILQEATTSRTWGIGAGLRSKAARTNTGTGENIFGLILTDLRAEFKARPLSTSPDAR